MHDYFETISQMFVLNTVIFRTNIWRLVTLL